MSDLIVIQPQVTQLTVTEDVNQVVVSSVGVQGAKGDTGETGATGATGATGPSGVVAVTAPITNSGTSTSANIGVSAGSTSTAGVLQLTDSTSSTSTTTAATPNAVKTAYDLGNSQVMPFVSGYYYRGISQATTANTTATANTTYYVPFFVPVTTTFDRLAIRSGTTFSGTASVRLGIYNSSGGKPTTVLLDAGTVSVTASSTVYTITINQQLTPGIYWLVSNMQSAGSVNTFLGVTASAIILYTGQPTASNLQISNGFYYQTSVTGAFATAGTLLDGNFNAGPIVFGRAV